MVSLREKCSFWFIPNAIKLFNPLISNAFNKFKILVFESCQWNWSTSIPFRKLNPVNLSTDITTFEYVTNFHPLFHSLCHEQWTTIVICEFRQLPLWKSIIEPRKRLLLLLKPIPTVSNWISQKNIHNIQFNCDWSIIIIRPLAAAQQTSNAVLSGLLLNIEQ